VEERRETERGKFGAFVTYREASGPEREQWCFVRNICAEGAGLHVERSIDPGTRLLMSFHLPGESQPVNTAARVIWSQCIDDRTAHVGVEFDGIGSGDQARIICYIIKCLC